MRQILILLSVFIWANFSSAIALTDKAMGLHESAPVRCQVLKNKLLAKIGSQMDSGTTSTLKCTGKDIEVRTVNLNIQQTLVSAQASGKSVMLTFSDMPGEFYGVIYSLEIE